MSISYLFAGLVVRSRDASATWYATLLGRPADILPNDAEATWQLTGTSSLYLLADPVRAGHGVFTLVVDDLESYLEQVLARGITPGTIEEVGTAGRKSVIIDPDGNAVSVVQLA